MELRKINWRKDKTHDLITYGTINRNRVIMIHQIYKDRFEFFVSLRFGYGINRTVDTTEIKDVKKEALRVLNSYVSDMANEIKSLTI